MTKKVRISLLSGMIIAGCLIAYAMKLGNNDVAMALSGAMATMLPKLAELVEEIAAK